MGYICPLDKEIASHLQKAATMDKGQWVIKVGIDQYLGLSIDGPRIFSLEVWANRMMKGIEEFVRTPIDSMVQTALRGLLHCWMILGKMNDWTIYYEQGVSAERVTIERAPLDLSPDLFSFAKISNLMPFY